ncbi:DUF397 domain-containing protein [Streptomyces prunicolor]|uniref:DUF397 domain-containing protein n=1 Tax=Streptomyces prunicolor TaxID=67348 RepID=A0ABU4FL13_9ACTN|nr:DUF397 domain-containing protein [Streptomyces prunicolor]MDV7221305.1 DUF397 domain-containing protein [Streptomyces prunicolor]
MRAFEYRKSSYSDQAAECVEIATNIPTTVAVRDSKNPNGPSLHLNPTTWTAFQTCLRSTRS